MAEQKKLTDYEKKVYHGGTCNHYFYVHSHSENLEDTHVKDPTKNEWYRYTKTKRHVFYEDPSKRFTEIINADLIKQAGRPKGSKDKVKRIRRKKED